MKNQYFQNKLIAEIENQGIDFMRFVDISHLPETQTKGYSIAIVMGMALSKKYLKKVCAVPNFVEQLIDKKEIQTDEFHLTEIKTDEIADYISSYISSSGFTSFSQSEESLYKVGDYDKNRQATSLPHKTIAALGGLGWFGKSNLLITPDFGSAISMCTVLTNAPLESENYSPSESLCKNCTICIDVCDSKSLKGKIWKNGITRDEIIDVQECKPCLKCMAFCPYTRKYMDQKE